MRRLPALGWSAVVAALVLYQALNARAILTPDLNDFGRFWASSRAVLDGRSPYLAAIPATATGPVVDRNLNSPPVVYALAPLGLFAPRTALAIWAALSLTAVAGVFRLTIPVRPGSAGPMLALALSLGATGAQLKTGQIAFLIALPMAFSWRAMREKRTGRAGVWMGICLVAKPFLVLFPVVWILQRRYRPALASLAVTGGLHAVGLLCAGVTQYAEWWSLLRGVYWSALGLNLSITGFAQRVWQSDNPIFLPLWHEPRMVWLTVALLTAGALAFAYWWARQEREPDRDFLVVGLMALLVSPLGWAYYLWLIMPPFCVVAMEWLSARDTRSDWAIVAVMLLCVPAPALTAGQPNGLLTVTIGSAYFWGAILILRNAAVDARHAHHVAQLRHTERKRGDQSRSVRRGDHAGAVSELTPEV